MSWIQKLYETYEQCADLENETKNKLWPLSHLVKISHVEIIIDKTGKFRRVRKLERIEAPTLIPVTESSAGRTRGIAAHPLCEEIGYCASDFPAINPDKYDDYKQQLQQWCESTYTHPKVQAIWTYLKKGNLWSKLCEHEIFPVVVEDKKGKKTKIAEHKVFLRWRIEGEDDLRTGTWEDDDLIDAWISFDQTRNATQGFCVALGQKSRISQNNPRFVRHPGDGAKLISANDKTGYTFRGRFTDDTGQQACGISHEVTQKAHSALRWLIARQGFRNADQAIVAWAVSGKILPDPFENSSSLFLNSGEFSEMEEEPEQDNVGDVGQDFGIRLRKVIAGYQAKLDVSEDIVVIGLDSASTGRMAVTFYRELQGSEFLERIQNWHELYAWPQNFGKNLKFVGAPSPRDIAEAAYGRRLDDKLRKSTVERLLPCIIDSQRIPRDLVESAVRRTCNRTSFEKEKKGREWEWDKNLGIACALFKGIFIERKYQMALETERNTRDYLYGRLLAIADNIENYALKKAGENRETTAARLMQRFADRPFSTWRNIELALPPYKARLRSSEKTAGFLKIREGLLDKVMCSFQEGDFSSEKDRSLTGEFLLGYHCQRQDLFSSSKKDKGNENSDDDANFGN